MDDIYRQYCCTADLDGDHRTDLPMVCALRPLRYGGAKSTFPGGRLPSACQRSPMRG